MADEAGSVGQVDNLHAIVTLALAGGFAQSMTCCSLLRFCFIPSSEIEAIIAPSV